MLSLFTVRNFKSIIDLTVDFSYAEGKAPNGYKEMETMPFLSINSKKKFVPCLAIYGPNASGKTNILKALANLQKVIRDGIIGCFSPDKLHAELTDTYFSITFNINKNFYEYIVQYNDTEIVNESLSCKNELIFKITQGKLNFNGKLTKTYDLEKLREIFTVECHDAKKKQKVTFLNKIATNYAGLNKHISQVFNYLVNNIEIYPVTPSNHIPIGYGMEKLISTGKVMEINEAFEKIVSMIQKLDIDISRMSFERLPIDNINFYLNEIKDNNVNIVQEGKIFFVDNTYSYHKNPEGKEIKFKFSEESDGTQKIAGILGIFLSVLYKGGVLFIDELEQSLHPLLLKELIRLFKHKKYNTNNAQLIFTAHNTDILDNELLRISEIGIVNKSLKHGTSIRRVAEFEGVRNCSDFRKQYLNGEFSGIPFPYI